MQARNKNDNIIYAKARDLCSSAMKREYDFVFSRFLTPAEQIIYYTAVREEYPALLPRCFFFGGALQADRRVCVMVPSYVDVAGIASCSEIFSEEREALFCEIASTYALNSKETGRGRQCDGRGTVPGSFIFLPWQFAVRYIWY